MFLSIPHPHYFSHKENREIKQLYWFTVLNGFGIALVYIFEPIYLYRLGFGLPAILLYYVQVYCLYAVLVTLGARFASRFGFKRSILLSNVFYLLYWMALFGVSDHRWLFVVAPMFFALQKSFFWPAYDTLTAMASAETQRGRQIGVLSVLTQLVYIVGPFIGGFVSYKFGFFPLFGLAGSIVIISCWPLFGTREMKWSHKFGFRDLIKFTMKNPTNFFGYWGFAEDLMLMSLWPVVIFTTVHYVLGVGLITTFASLFAAVLMLYIGRVADRQEKPKLIEAGSFFYSITWLFRFLAVSTPGVIVFDVLTKIGKGMVNVPVTALTLETAKSKPGLTLLYATFYEFSLSIGKIFTALLGIVILDFTNNVYIVFFFVGFLTLFYSFLTKEIHTNGSEAK